MSLWRYIYHKCFAVILRTLTRISWVIRRVSVRPDEVRTISSRDAGRTLRVHVYRSGSFSGPSPVLLNWHGSGFMLPLHGSDDEYCRRVSRETKYTVLDLPYRKSPEHPFPAALHDVEDAVNYVLGRPDEFDLSHVSLSGFSAGANLALALSATLFPPATFRSLIAIYPPLDLHTDPGAKVAPDPSGRVIPVPVARVFSGAYVPINSQYDRRDPRVSPAFAPLENFPRRLLVVTASGDSLAPEAEDFAHRLQQQPGWHVVLKRMEGCNHGWDKQHPKPGTPQHQAKDDAYRLAIEMLNE
ncbi:CAZyme family CE10 [Penicillium riverlandense]|uniref:CAZyme family CE10 n=1 Tax=Penicillium riverlandense TaxID=1903569 RepID=UPI0025496513|nr:CAZyme family CE10 [Penicillium riverlandense]KAJ5820323.1 CAZyme family CE10 [Penicillium riverlandense]